MANRNGSYCEREQFFGLKISDFTDEQLMKIQSSKLVEFLECGERRDFIAKIIGDRIINMPIGDLEILKYCSTENSYIKEKYNEFFKINRDKIFNYDNRCNCFFWEALNKENKINEFSIYIDNKNNSLINISIYNRS